MFFCSQGQLVEVGLSELPNNSRTRAPNLMTLMFRDRFATDSLHWESFSSSQLHVDTVYRVTQPHFPNEGWYITL